MFDFLPILWYNIAVSLQSKLRLCHCKLRLPAILTASQKCSRKQAFLLHGGIAVKATPVYIRFVENNFAFSAVRKKYKDAFLFSYFSVTKSTKSHLRGLSPLSRRRQPTHCVHWFIPPLLKNSLRVHELVAGSSAWQVRAVKGGAKVGSFTTSHDFNHTTRANISHEKAEQIRARIVCTPAESALAGVNLICALTELSK